MIIISKKACRITAALLSTFGASASNYVLAHIMDRRPSDIRTERRAYKKNQNDLEKEKLPWSHSASFKLNSIHK